MLVIFIRFCIVQVLPIHTSFMTQLFQLPPLSTLGDDENEKPLSVAEKSLLQKVLHKGLVENKYDIEIERRNPKSPLYSVKSFEALNLKPQLLKVNFLNY
jgi:hypothetical protein